jgi:predicted dehydrogenase
MAKAALDAGAHVLTEKPFTNTLAEADALLADARRKGLRIAVAHQMRLAPSIVNLQRLVANGAVGELVQIRSWGKQDSRAGGEDLLVLGTHIFDLMRLFAGEPVTCNARVLTDGREITRADAHPATEKIGPIAGEEIEAQFGFANGVAATFTSRGRLRETLGQWGLELLGSKGAVRILMDIDPVVLQRRRSQPAPAGTGIIDEWLPAAGDPSGASGERGFGPANTRVVLDWLAAIEANCEPKCSGENAAKALEFVMAIYESALEHRTARMPLARREHPLAW